MTIQQHASFDSSAAELNATSKLVKAWESKNAKNAARAGGVSLMALSLAACGGSDDVAVDLTPFAQSDIDTAVAAANTAAAATAVTVADAAATALAEAVAAVDLTTNDAAVIAAALTDADGIAYPTVDAAITAAQSQDVSAAVAAAEAAILGDYADRTSLIESNDAAVTTAATNAAEATLVAGTGFASVAALKAAYDDATGAPTPMSTDLSTSNDVVTGFTSGADNVGATQATLASGDVVVDGFTGDGDTLTVTSSTADLSLILPVVSGIENVNYNFTSFAEANVGATNISATNLTLTQSQVGGDANGTVTGAGSITVNAGSGITGTLTVTQTNGTDLTINGGSASAVAHSVASTTATSVVVNGSASTTSLTTDAGPSGTITVNGTATDRQISATGSDLTVTSSFVGTEVSGTTDSEITIIGEAGAADTASVSAVGFVTLTNTGALSETVTLSGNGAAATYLLTDAVGTSIDLAGDQDVSLRIDTEADVAGKTITSSTTGAAEIRITATVGDADLSKFDSDIVVRLDDITSGQFVTVDSGVTIDYRDADASDVLDLVSSSAAGATGDSVNIVANHATTAITNGSAAADGSGTDVFSTVNVTSDTVAVTALTAIIGAANDLTVGGSKAITLATTSTAKSVTNTGTTVSYNIDGTNDFATINGHATATDTLLVATAGINLTAEAFSNIDIINVNGAASDDALVVKSSQVSGETISIIGSLNVAAKDSVTVNADAGTIDLSGITVNTVGMGTVTVDLTTVAAGATNITGTNSVDALTGQGAGVITMDGKGGADTITGGSAADNLTGGEGGDTLTGVGGSDNIILTEVVAAQDTVEFDWASGEVDTITGFTVGTAATRDVVAIDFSDITDGTTVEINLIDVQTIGTGAAVKFQEITLGSTFDLGTAAANSNVMVFDGDVADAATLATALNNGGSTELRFEGAMTINDGMFALYDNGTTTQLALVTSALGVLDEANATDLVVTDLIVFADVSDATTLDSTNFTFA